MFLGVDELHLLWGLVFGKGSYPVYFSVDFLFLKYLLISLKSQVRGSSHSSNRSWVFEHHSLYLRWRRTDYKHFLLGELDFEILGPLTWALAQVGMWQFCQPNTYGPSQQPRGLAFSFHWPTCIPGCFLGKFLWDRKRKKSLQATGAFGFV